MLPNKIKPRKTKRKKLENLVFSTSKWGRGAFKTFHDLPVKMSI
jgi:hypothetical protein